MEIQTFGKRKLPVLEVVKRSYGYTWEHRQRLALPVFALTAVYAIYYGVLSRLALPWLISVAPSPFIARAVTYGWQIPILIVALAFTVGAHRTVLLNEFRGSMTFFCWDRNLGRYLLAFVKVMLSGIPIAGILTIAMVPLIIFFGAHQSQSKLLVFVFLIVFALIFALLALSLRLALVFPAAAIGEEQSLTLSWRSTQGNWFRFAAIAFLVVFPLSLVGILPAFSLFTGLDLTHFAIILQLISAAAHALNTTLTAIMLSFAYDVLLRNGILMDDSTLLSDSV